MNIEDGDEELWRQLLKLYQLTLEEPTNYWHFDEDFAAFMDAVLEPVSLDE